MRRGARFGFLRRLAATRRAGHRIVSPLTATIQAQIEAASLAGGGTIDLRRYAGDQAITEDLFAYWQGGPETRIVLKFGPTKWTWTGTTLLPSHTTVMCEGTEFVAGAALPCFGLRQRSIGANCTAGNPTITPNISGAAAFIGLGDPVILYGHRPRGGKDTVELDGAHNSSVTTLTIIDTTGLPAAGTVRIDNELISYTGRTGTTLTGCTRGDRGTTAASHSSGADVDRVVYETFIATDVGSTTLDLENPGSANPTVEIGVTGTAVDCVAGPQDVSILGEATVDGGGVVGASFLHFINGRFLWCDPGFHQRRFPSFAQGVTACRDAEFYGSFEQGGDRGANTGHGQVVVGGSKRVRIEGRFRDMYTCQAVDDRSVTPTFYDNPNEHCQAILETGFDCDIGTAVVGGRSCLAHIKEALNFVTVAGILGGGQWIDNALASVQNTIMVVDVVAPAPALGAVDCQAGSTASGNTVISRTPDVPVTGDDVAGVTVFKETTAAHVISKGLTVGALTTNGGLQTFGANDSAGSGFRQVRVPNA